MPLRNRYALRTFLHTLLIPALALTLAACAAPSASGNPAAAASPALSDASTATPADTLPAAYSIPETQVLDVDSAVLKRQYQVYVALPESYASQPQRRYPVVFVTDATYAFPLTRAISRRVGDHGDGLEDFILVGLSYAKGDSPAVSRRRDYTPTPNGPASSRDDAGRMPVHGEAEGYRRHLAQEVFPLLARTYRADMQRKIFAGHSYGALLGAHILFTEPSMFQHYILGSPSLWYDGGVMFKREAQYAAGHRDLAANVFMGIGSYERANPAANDPRYNDEGDMVGDMLRMEKVLRSRKYPGLRVASTVIQDEDHLTVAPVIITRGLRQALPPVAQR